MADNVELSSGSGGAIVAGASLSISGDTAIVQFVGCGILAGSEGAWTFTHFVGGAGAVAAGVQRVTLASDDPGVALLGTIDADTGSILTAVQLIDDAVYIDDADWTNDTSKHILVGGLYQSTPQTVTDGDVAPFNMTANGAMHVAVQNTVTVASHAVTNAGTFAVQAVCTNGGTFVVQENGAALTALQLIDDAVYVDDADWTDGTSKHILVGGLYQSTPQTVTDGDVAPFNITVGGALHVAVQNTLTVASHAVTNSGTFAVQSAQSGTWTVDLGATDNAVLDAIAASVAAADTDLTTIIGHVDGLEALIGTTNTNTGNAATSLAILDDWDNANSDGASVTGDVAHDAADAGEPVKIGAKAETSPKAITVVADGDRTDLYADSDGMLMVKLNTSGADFIQERVSNTDGSSTAFSTFGAAANLKNVVTTLAIYRTDSGTSLIYVDFRDGAAGSIIFSVPIPPAGGVVLNGGGMPIFKQPTANTALAYDVSAATTTVYISCSGYQTKV